jgi:hypothetical protein
MRYNQESQFCEMLDRTLASSVESFTLAMAITCFVLEEAYQYRRQWEAKLKVY